LYTAYEVPSKVSDRANVAFGGAFTGCPEVGTQIPAVVLSGMARPQADPMPQTEINHQGRH
jgi:hypothetical protein